MNLCRTTDTISQAVGDELLLLEQQVGRLHHLNSTAAWIYERCDGRSSDAIANELSQTYGVDRSTAIRDLDTIAKQLAQLGLIQLDAPPASTQSA